MLLVQVFGCGEALRTCDGIYDALNDAILEVVDAGIIDRDGYESFYQPVYFRTLDELTAPDAGSRLTLASHFRLDRAETYEVTVPFVEAFRRTGDAARFAKDYTDFFRAFTEPVLRSAFAAHSDLDRLTNDVFERAERLIRHHPDRYEFHYLAIAMLLTRRAS